MNLSESVQLKCSRYDRFFDDVSDVIDTGIGTSAPEMVVSAISAYEGNSGLALGNAIGSNIVNIALILGVTAIVSPIMVNSKIVKKEIPLLLLIVFLTGYLLLDNSLTLFEGVIEDIKEIMESIFVLNVPLKVSVGVANSWQDLK